MGIKKIIKEEVNDFEWVKNISAVYEPVTESNAYVGMYVKISQHSNYYSENENDSYWGDATNPSNTVGVIDSISKNYSGDYVEHPIQVNWLNGSNGNVYRFNVDLVVAPYNTTDIY